jgi:hypothetical protein
MLNNVARIDQVLLDSFKVLMHIGSAHLYRMLDEWRGDISDDIKATKRPDVVLRDGNNTMRRTTFRKTAPSGTSVP